MTKNYWDLNRQDKMVLYFWLWISHNNSNNNVYFCVAEGINIYHGGVRLYITYFINPEKFFNSHFKYSTYIRKDIRESYLKNDYKKSDNSSHNGRYK